jgi:hypothetical protein
MDGSDRMESVHGAQPVPGSFRPLEQSEMTFHHFNSFSALLAHSRSSSSPLPRSATTCCRAEQRQDG